MFHEWINKSFNCHVHLHVPFQAAECRQTVIIIRTNELGFTIETYVHRMYMILIFHIVQHFNEI